MLVSDTRKLKEELGPDRGHRVYFLYGNENYLIERYAAKLTARFGGGMGAFNLQRFGGTKPDLDDIADAVEALPLMAAEKCVFIDDLDVAKLPAAEFKKLEELLDRVPAECTLLLTAKAPGFDMRSAAGKKLIKLADAAGCAARLDTPSPAGLQDFVKSLAKKGGCGISSDTCRYLLSVCASDMHAIKNEMDKLCAYVGGGEITRARIDAIVAAKTEARAFDLGKAVLAGNCQRALEILDSLFYLREQPVAILAALSTSFADLYRARIAKDAGKRPADLVLPFGYKGKEFRIENAFSACAPFSAAELRRALDILYGCDRALKSTAVSGRILLERAVVELYALASRRGA